MSIAATGNTLENVSKGKEIAICDRLRHLIQKCKEVLKDIKYSKC